MKKIFYVLTVAAAFMLVSAMPTKAEIFFAYLNGAQEVPPSGTSATGYSRIVLNESAGTISFTVVFNNLSSAQTASHIHTGVIGVSGPITINFGAVGGLAGTISGTAPITPAQIALMRSHQFYVNIHSTNFPGGEIRGQLGGKRPVDFDGDGRNDYSILRFPGTGTSRPFTYYNLNSTAAIQSAAFGEALTDLPAPGDYDGDGLDDIALYRVAPAAGGDSYFFIMRSSDSTFQAVAFGTFGDQNVARDYDGDGKTDFAVFRRGAAANDPAIWFICQSATVAPGACRVNFRAVQFGITGNSAATNGDKPVPGDYDGDGKFDIAVYRFGGLSPNNTFIILRSSDSGLTFQPWGDFTSDYILPGDYDGDGKYDFCAARTGATNTTPVDWYILQSSNGQSRTTRFGITSDIPVQGDYDGDARTDIAVYRRGATTGAQSFFYVIRSFDNTFQTTPWGARDDFPVNSFDIR